MSSHICVFVCLACQQLLSCNDLVIHGGLRQRTTVHKIVENALPTSVINIKCTSLAAPTQ